jgi:hypothetical protein
VDIAIGDPSPLNALFEEEFKGDTLSTRMKQIQQQRAEEEARRLRDKLKYEKKMEEERIKERELLKKRMANEQAKKEQRDNEQKELRKIKEQNIESTEEKSDLNYLETMKDETNPSGSKLLIEANTSSKERNTTSKNFKDLTNDHNMKDTKESYVDSKDNIFSGSARA